METLGYYNGKIGALEEMSVPMLDRGCYFGDGVYDATYSRNHIIYSAKEHIDRFLRSAGLVDINIDMSAEELNRLLCELVQMVDCGEQFVYWQATRAVGMRKHSYGSNDKANIWVMLKPANIVDTYKKVKLITLEDTRFYHCNVKTLNLLPNVLAAQKTEEAGCDECVFHRDGRVTECAHSNVHIIKNGVFKTAPTDNLILPGIARAHIIKMCGRLGIPVEEKPFYLDELFEADEVIVSSSGSLCLSAESVDGKSVGGKAPALLTRLQDALLDDFIASTDPPENL